MEKREQILDVALELFYSRGYDSVGVQEIAKKAGVTKPTLYYYFKSKYGLLVQLIQEGSVSFLKQLERACVFEGDLKETLYMCARVFADFAEWNPKFYHLLFSMFHFPHESDAYRAVQPIILRQQRAVQGIFEAASYQLGNMHGRQKQFSLGFAGLINYFIEMRSEESVDGNIHILDEEIYSLVHQFMHGIYS